MYYNDKFGEASSTARATRNAHHTARIVCVAALVGGVFVRIQASMVVHGVHCSRFRGFLYALTMDIRQSGEGTTLQSGLRAIHVNSVGLEGCGTGRSYEKCCLCFKRSQTCRAHSMASNAAC